MGGRGRSFVVVGLGTFGGTVAAELVRFGNHVLGIDSDERRLSRFASTLSQAVIADGRDELALREAGVGNYDVMVVAIGEDLEANIVCTMNAKMIGVPIVWAKAVTRTHHRILTKIGADRVILPEQEIGQHIAQMLHTPLVRDYVSLGNGFHVVTLIVPERLAGRAVGGLRLAEQFDLRCLGLMRGGEYVGCEEPTVILKRDDKLLVLGRRQAFRTFVDSL